MSKLLRFEFRKLFHQKSYFVCVGLALFSNVLPLIMAIVFAGEDTILYDASTLRMAESILDVIKDDLYLFIMIYTVIFIAADYSERTILPIIGKGYSRTMIYFSKLIVTLVSATGLIAVLMVSRVFLCLVGGEIGTFTAETFRALGAQYFAAMADAIMAFFIAATAKKVGAGITAGVLGAGVGAQLLFAAAEDLLARADIHWNLSDYWLDNAIMPLYYGYLSRENVIRGVTVAIAYSAAFLTLGWLATRKHEV